jgi:hypothetical protein
MSINRSMGAAVVALLVLAGCSAKRSEVALAPPPPPVPAPQPMPQPPAGSRVDMTIPARLADGSYATPNRALSAAATVWHVRVALNVAALGCRGPQGDAITAGYNAMLTAQKSTLTTAHDQLVNQLGGQDAYDSAMTELYNFFAQPGATAAFCQAAAQVIGTAGSSADLSSAAAPTLATLDAPFQDFYRRYDAYRTQLAEWQADRLHRAMTPIDTTPQVAFAAAAPAPVADRNAPPARAPHLSVDPAVFRMP